jgi:hypothetical protein
MYIRPPPPDCCALSLDLGWPYEKSGPAHDAYLKMNEIQCIGSNVIGARHGDITSTSMFYFS